MILRDENFVPMDKHIELPGKTQKFNEPGLPLQLSILTVALASETRQTSRYLLNLLMVHREGLSRDRKQGF